MASSEDIGNMITYKATYLSRDYPILLTFSGIYKDLDTLVTEVDFEYVKCVCKKYPLLYILHRESYSAYGMRMFRCNSKTWGK